MLRFHRSEKYTLGLLFLSCPGISFLTQRRKGLIRFVMNEIHNSLGIDIGSTTVKIAILNSEKKLLFADYERHFANIQGTLATLLKRAKNKRLRQTWRLSLAVRMPKSFILQAASTSV